MSLYLKPAYNKAVKEVVRSINRRRAKKLSISSGKTESKVKRYGNWIVFDVTDREYLEFEWSYMFCGFENRRVQRVNTPVRLYVYRGGSSQFVLDSAGIMHGVPSNGERGCVTRWKPKKGCKPLDLSK